MAEKSEKPKTMFEDIKSATQKKNEQLKDIQDYQSNKPSKPLKQDGGFYGHMKVTKGIKANDHKCY